MISLSLSLDGRASPGEVSNSKNMAWQVPPGPSDSIKCYQCSSLEGGQCDGHYPGEQVFVYVTKK